MAEQDQAATWEPGDLRHFYVGICGFPKSGKTTLAERLSDRREVQLVDDGRPLRDAVKAIYGVSEWSVVDQKGKASAIVVSGKQYTVRQILGDLGEMLEDYHGQQIMPWLAITRAEREIEKPSVILLPSVRKTQGRTILATGGFMVEVRREGTKPIYPFDKYTRIEGKSWLTIVNDGTLESLFSQGESIIGLALDALEAQTRTWGHKWDTTERK